MKALREYPLQLRKINWGPPVEDTGAKPLSFDDAALKARRAGAPLRSLLALAEPRETPALNATRRWFGAHRDKPLVMLGPTGLGKSTAAAWACVEFAKTYPWNDGPGGGRQREPLVWLEATELVRLTEWTEVGKEYADRCLRASLLVIDDAGHEGTVTGKQALVDLLMKRTDSKASTVLATNLTGAEFRARYTEPLADRLRNWGYVPELGGGDSQRERTP